MSDRAVRIARSAASWALGASATTAAVSALGRALCLPPYWPSEYFLRCRPLGFGAALLRAPADAIVTTLLLLVPALVAGMALFALLAWMERLGRPRAVRIAWTGGGMAMWMWLAGRMEPSHLDFILGGYAKGAGALAGAWIAWRAARTG